MSKVPNLCRTKNPNLLLTSRRVSHLEQKQKRAQTQVSKLCCPSLSPHSTKFGVEMSHGKYRRALFHPCCGWKRDSQQTREYLSHHRRCPCRGSGGENQNRARYAPRTSDDIPPEVKSFGHKWQNPKTNWQVAIKRIYRFMQWAIPGTKLPLGTATYKSSSNDSSTLSSCHLCSSLFPFVNWLCFLTVVKLFPRGRQNSHQSQASMLTTPDSKEKDSSSSISNMAKPGGAL